MSPLPVEPLQLLGLTSGELQEAAREWFGATKGAGLARSVHRMATREGRLDPATLGAGPRASAVWRARARLDLPAVVETKREGTARGTLDKRVLRLGDGRVI